MSRYRIKIDIEDEDIMPLSKWKKRIGRIQSRKRNREQKEASLFSQSITIDMTCKAIDRFMKQYKV